MKWTTYLTEKWMQEHGLSPSIAFRRWEVRISKTHNSQEIFLDVIPEGKLCNAFKRLDLHHFPQVQTAVTKLSTPV